MPGVGGDEIGRYRAGGTLAARGADAEPPADALGFQATALRVDQGGAQKIFLKRTETHLHDLMVDYSQWRPRSSEELED